MPRLYGTSSSRLRMFGFAVADATDTSGALTLSVRSLPYTSLGTDCDIRCARGGMDTGVPPSVPGGAISEYMVSRLVRLRATASSSASASAASSSSSCPVETSRGSGAGTGASAAGGSGSAYIEASSLLVSLTGTIRSAIASASASAT